MTVEKVYQPPREAPETPAPSADVLDARLLTNFSDAQRLLNWIRKKGLREVKRKQVMQRGPGTLRKARRARAALRVLVECRMLITDDDKDFLLTPAALAATGVIPDSLELARRVRAEHKPVDFDWSHYPWLNREAVDQLQAYREKMGWKRLDWCSLTLLASKLEPFDTETQHAMFRQTIVNGWKGVYPLEQDL